MLNGLLRISCLILSFCFALASTASAASPGPRAENYKLWLGPDQKINRSGVLNESLTWVIVQDGEIVLERLASNELSYTYYNNVSGHEYFAYLQQWGGNYYVRVSNIVGYRYGLVSDAPIITSQRVAVAVVNQPFRYVISATGEGNVFTASNLPPGLALDDQGVISGTPTRVDSSAITLTAANGQNVGTAGLTLNVVSGINDGGLTNRHTLVLESNYSVTWNEDPANTNLTLVIKSDGAQVLGRNVLGKSHDRGYFYNSSYSVYTLHLESFTASGYTRVSNIVAYQPGAPWTFPLITSALSATGTLGTPFAGYQILAQNSPTAFSASGLPSGLSISSSGLITGVPGESGVFPIVLRAANASGSDQKTLTLIINSSTPSTLFTLGMNAAHIVTRSAGTVPGLCWVVRDAGVEVLRRVATNETSYLYFRDSLSTGYTIHLEAWLDGAYRRVSNTVGNTPATLFFLGDTRLTVRAGQAMPDYVLQLNAPYQTLTVGTLPAGIIRSGATLSGTPATPGIYPVALNATSGATTATRTLVIEVLPAASSQTQDNFTLRLDTNFTATRNVGELENLLWVVTKDGEVVLRRLAKSELAYTYHRNFLAGDYTIYLEALVQGVPTRVSNIVGYVTPAYDGAPVFSTPRRLLLQVSRPFTLQLVASGSPSFYQATGLPAGLTVGTNGLLSGTPGTAGTYPVTFSATQSGLTGTANFTVEISPPPATATYVDRHRLSLGSDLTITRTPGNDPNLTWVIKRNSAELLSRLTRDELSYCYYRNFDPGTYTVHLEAILDGAYRIVSNTVTYTIGAEPGQELLRHALGAVNGDSTTFIEPKLAASQLSDGSPALTLTYTVNRTDPALTITLEESANLRDWSTVASPQRRILGGDETFELREDTVPVTAGALRFHRVKIVRAQPVSL